MVIECPLTMARLVYIGCNDLFSAVLPKSRKGKWVYSLADLLDDIHGIEKK